MTAQPRELSIPIRLTRGFHRYARVGPSWPQNGHLRLLNDPAGLKRSLVPVLVRQCSAEKLLKPIIYIDLIGLNEEPAEKRVMEGIKGKRAKPIRKPNFPAIADVPTERERPKFPGYSAPESPRTSVRIPKLQRPPSDLEKRRFIERVFLSIVEYFQSTLKELTRQNEGLETDFPRPWRCASLPWA